MATPGLDANGKPFLDDNGNPIMTGLIGDMDPKLAAYKQADQQMATNLTVASPWVNMGTNQQATDQASSLANTGGIQAGALDQAKSNMAMRGGLGGGAASRMGRASADNAAMAQQDINRQGASDSLGAQMTGADMTSATDQANAGISQGVQAFNTQGNIKNLQGKNAYDLAKYGTDIKGFGAGQSANALLAAGGGKK
jgi:hypothetical protein